MIKRLYVFALSILLLSACSSETPSEDELSSGLEIPSEDGFGYKDE